MHSRAALASLSLFVIACRQPIPEKLEDKQLDPASPPSSHAVASSSAVGGIGEAPKMGTTAMPERNDPAHGEVRWDAPSRWVSAPNPSPMRKATYRIPKAAGDTEDAELAISAASGGVEPNVKRWEQQFQGGTAKTEARTPNGLKVTLVEVKGTFAGGGMMGKPSEPKKDQMLLGAIVDLGEGQMFFKLTGGEKTVASARKEFDTFVASFRTK